MARVIWTETALQELDQIADYISLDNPTVAKKLVRKAFQRVDRLDQYPKIGKSVQELEESIYRELVVSSCRIFYREENGILYIIHGMREEQLLRIELLKSR